MSKLCLTNEILGAMTPKATDADIKYALDSIDSECILLITLRMRLI